MTQTPFLSAIGLSKAFGPRGNRTPVLKGLDLALDEGSLTLLVGPSGSGKSTLLAALAGLQQPDVGTVEFRGKNIWRDGRRSAQAFRHSHCAFVFQQVHLLPVLTASEQVRFLLEQSGMASAKAHRRAVHYLTQVGLEHRLDALPAQLSGGEQQRVAIARALALHPTIIFADEPTSALDSENGRQIAELLYRVAREDGTTVLAVTHDSRVKEFAQRTISMIDGSLSEAGSDD